MCGTKTYIEENHISLRTSIVNSVKGITHERKGFILADKFFHKLFQFAVNPTVLAENQ